MLNGRAVPHDAVDHAFGIDVDYATMTKVCGKVHFIRGAAESHDADVDAPVDASYECVREESRVKRSASRRRWRGCQREHRRGPLPGVAAVHET
jgi:hypothetical protein